MSLDFSKTESGPILGALVKGCRAGERWTCAMASQADSEIMDSRYDSGINAGDMMFVFR
jgi:hypothetical protein